MKDTSGDMVSTIRNCISTADSAALYLLDPRQQDSSSLNGFKVTRYQKIEQQYLAELAQIFSDSTNFKKSKFLKNCTFLPDVRLQFYNKTKGNTEILIANYCDVTQMTYQDTVFVFNSERNRVTNLALLKKILATK
jgi:hypothetical protein